VCADPVPDREAMCFPTGLIEGSGAEHTTLATVYRWEMPIDDPMDAWWNSLTADQQAEALTIPQKLPEWMSTSERASEILANWQAGTEPAGDFMSDELRKFLETKREP
jgi:hypothetical protein